MPLMTGSDGLAMHRSNVKELIKLGNLAALEEVVLQGYGDRLLGEKSGAPLVQDFLDNVPDYIDQITELHKAAMKGNLRKFQSLLDRKAMIVARDQIGATPLHKAVLYGHYGLAEYIATNFPATLDARDNNGRTALHFAAALDDDRAFYNMLVKAGSSPLMPDFKGKNADFYLRFPDQINLQQILKRSQRLNANYAINTANRIKSKSPSRRMGRSLSPRHRVKRPSDAEGIHARTSVDGQSEEGLSDRADTSSNDGSNASLNQPTLYGKLALPSPAIQRIEVSSADLKRWIQENNYEKLEGAVLEGHGDRLKQKAEHFGASDHSSAGAQIYIAETVPKIMNKMRIIHAAVSCGDLVGLQDNVEKRDYLLSKDHLGMAPLHKATIMGHIDVVQYILEKFPEVINARDKEGRCALHYAAATTNRNGNKIYKMLMRAGADPRIRDSSGKTCEYYRVHLLSLPTEFSRSNSKKKLNPIYANTEFAAPKRRPILLPSVQEKINIALHEGDAKQLLELALDGFGDNLFGRTAYGDDARKFLKNLPHLMDSIKSLHASIMNGDLSNVERILGNDSTLIRAKDENGLLPVHIATAYNQLEIVRHIVETYPQTLQMKDTCGRTPLHISAQNKSIDIYRKLIELGGDPKIMDQKGKTADHYLRAQTLQSYEVIPPINGVKMANGKHAVNGKLPTQLKEVERRKSRAAGKVVKTQNVKFQAVVDDNNCQPNEDNDTVDDRQRLSPPRRLPALFDESQGQEKCDEEGKGNDNENKISDEFGYENDDNANQLQAKRGDNEKVCENGVETENCETLVDTRGEKDLNEKISDDNNNVVDVQENVVISDNIIKSQNVKIKKEETSGDRKADAVKCIEIVDNRIVKEMEDRIRLEREAKFGFAETETNDQTLENSKEQENRHQITDIQNETESEKVIDSQLINEKEKENIAETDANCLPHSEPIADNLESIVKSENADNGDKCMSDIADQQPVCNGVDSGQTKMSEKLNNADESKSGANQNARKKSIGSKSSSAKSEKKVSRSLSNQSSAGSSTGSRKSSVTSVTRPNTRSGSKLESQRKNSNESNKILRKRSSNASIKSKSGSKEDINQNVDSIAKSNSEQSANQIANQLVDQSLNALSIDAIKNSEIFQKEDPQLWLKKIEEENELAVSPVHVMVPQELPAVSVSVENTANTLESEAIIEEKSGDETREDNNRDEAQPNRTVDDLPVVENNDNQEKVVSKENPVESEAENVADIVLESRDSEHLMEKSETQASTDQTVAETQEQTNAEINNNNVDKSDSSAKENKVEMSEINENKKEETESKVRSVETRSATAPHVRSFSQQSDGNISTHAEDRLNELIDHWLDDRDLLRLEHVVIAGQGERLIGRKSSDKQVQDFLDLVPTYMSKIRGVHETVIRGNLNEVKQVLTRKRFALSRDQYGASPLHLAVLHGHTEVMVYIITQFPETIDGPDNEGRTPLHYAAVVNDPSLQYYKILETAGANVSQKDKSDHTPQYYLDHPGELTLRQLLENYKNIANSLTATAEVWQRPPTADIESRLTPTPDDTDSPTDSPNRTHKHEVDAEVHVDADERRSNMTKRSTFERSVSQSSYKTKDSAPDDEDFETISNEFQKSLKEEKVRLQKSFDRQMSTAEAEITMTGTVIESVQDGRPAMGAAIMNGMNTSGYDLTEIKDENGRTVLHLVAAKPQKRSTFYRLLSQAEYLIPERDAQYRTIRDVSVQNGIKDNLQVIDQFIIDAFIQENVSLVRVLSMEGYANLLNVVDAEGHDVIELLKRHSLTAMISMAQDLAAFLASRDELHTFIRHGYAEGVLNLTQSAPDLVVAKSERGRCALHIAVLFANLDIVDTLINSNPKAVNTPDNMGRTPLHYAMASSKVEQIGRSLIKAGANRAMRDVRMRTASYYFVYKQEIRDIKKEEQNLTI